MSDIRWVLWRPTEAGAGYEEVIAEFTAPDKRAAEAAVLDRFPRERALLESRVAFDVMTDVARRARERRERTKPWLVPPR